ncbi:MAG: sodium:proton antiporter [Candidatus Hydrogenedentales bacterium]
MNPYLVDLAVIIIAGIGAQWLAWRFQLPSILLLLIMGFLVGLYVDPDALFGELLMPFVSVSVAIILFEGGMELRLNELREAGGVVIKLVTIGIIVTWVIAASAAAVFLEFSRDSALLLGAILVVTGPTVIGPLLRQIRPRGTAGSILKWEGLFNDAIGAVLAVLVFEAILVGLVEHGASRILLGVALTLLTGVAVGATLGLVLVYIIRQHWVPDQLDVVVTIAFIVGAFALSNVLQHESGLLAVIIMGVIVANQRFVDVRHLVDFKENLRVLLLSLLFIILAARIDAKDVIALGWPSLVFVAALVLIARPLTIFVCTFGNKLSLQEKLFMSFMAPRGIVAAAVASVFGLRMADEGLADADKLTPAAFLVITTTVALYGLMARPLAHRLGLAQTNRQGIVMVGAHPLPRRIATALQNVGFEVLLVDVNRRYVTDARLEGLHARYGDALSEKLVEQLDLSDKGKLLAMTANDQVNTLAVLHFAHVFGRADVYQIAPDGAVSSTQGNLPMHLRGRTLFGKDYGYMALSARLREGAVVKVTKLTEEYDYEAYQAQQGGNAILLFVITEDNRLLVNTQDKPLEPQPGQRVVGLVSSQTAGEQAPVTV